MRFILLCVTSLVLYTDIKLHARMSFISVNVITPSLASQYQTSVNALCIIYCTQYIKLCKLLHYIFKTTSAIWYSPTLVKHCLIWTFSDFATSSMFTLWNWSIYGKNKYMHIEKKGMSHEKRQYIKPLASHENKIIGKCYSLYVVWYGYNILSIT